MYKPDWPKSTECCNACAPYFWVCHKHNSFSLWPKHPSPPSSIDLHLHDHWGTMPVQWHGSLTSYVMLQQECSYLNSACVVSCHDELTIMVEPDHPDRPETFLRLDHRVRFECRHVDKVDSAGRAADRDEGRVGRDVSAEKVIKYIILARLDHQEKCRWRDWPRYVGTWFVPTSTPGFLGEASLNLTLGLVTYCGGRQTAWWRPVCRWRWWGPWALVTQ